MAKLAPSIFEALGLVVWGDIGPFTVWRSKRGRIVWYAKAPPKEPPSQAQLHYRFKWKQAAIDWMSRSDAVKANWELASKRLSLRTTGYNLFLYWRVTNDRATINSVERQSSLTLD